MTTSSAETTTLSIGDKAPKFTLPTTLLDGSKSSPATLADFKGRKLILYFYPKDDTSGCTTQAIAFSLARDDFEQAGTGILGISKDSLTRHEKFTQKHNLTIPLGSDPEGETLETYGVWVEKNMYGRQYMGIERTTFLIDEKGIICQIWRKVRVKNHVATVLEAVRAL